MITTQLATYPVSHTIPTIPRTFQPAVTRRIDGSNDLRRLLNRFEPITLAEMDAVALLDRTDTKYVMRTDQLYTALAGVSTPPGPSVVARHSPDSPSIREVAA